MRSMQCIRFKQSIHKIHCCMHKMNLDQMRNVWRVFSTNRTQHTLHVNCPFPCTIRKIHKFKRMHVTKVKRFSLHLLHFALHCKFTNQYFGCVCAYVCVPTFARVCVFQRHYANILCIWCKIDNTSIFWIKKGSENIVALDDSHTYIRYFYISYCLWSLLIHIIL